MNVANEISVGIHQVINCHILPCTTVQASIAVRTVALSKHSGPVTVRGNTKVTTHNGNSPRELDN